MRRYPPLWSARRSRALRPIRPIGPIRPTRPIGPIVPSAAEPPARTKVIPARDHGARPDLRNRLARYMRRQRNCRATGKKVDSVVRPNSTAAILTIAGKGRAVDTKGSGTTERYRYGIGEWYGLSFVNLTGEKRRGLARIHTSPGKKRDMPCIPQGRVVPCNKPSGICSIRVYQHNGNEVTVALGEMRHRVTVHWR